MLDMEKGMQDLWLGHVQFLHCLVFYTCIESVVIFVLFDQFAVLSQFIINSSNYKSIDDNLIPYGHLRLGPRRGGQGNVSRI